MKSNNRVQQTLVTFFFSHVEIKLFSGSIRETVSFAISGKCFQQILSEIKGTSK